MDLRLTPEQSMLQDSVRRFVAAEYGFAQRRARLADPSRAAGLWQRLAEMGWLAAPFAEDRGGLGGSLAEVAVIMEAFGRALVVEPYVSTLVLAGGVLDAAPAAVRDPLLGAVMAGELQLALAHDEPGPSVATRVATGAETDGGVRLTGRKLLVLGAPEAGRLIVSALPDGAQGPALFLVRPDAAGLGLHPLRTVDGFSAAHVTLDGVAAEPLIEDPVAAAAALDAAVDRAVVAVGAEALGACSAVLDMTREHVATRRQFGRAVGEFQVVQHRLADMFIEIERLRGALLDALAASDGAAPGRMRAASALKVQVGSAAQFVTAQGIQLHGGMGVTEDHAVGHYFKRVTVLERLFGSSAAHLARYAGLMQA